ncbi:MAG: transglutaminase-like domain-containing protein [Thermodesulfobacteriota bacterium]
MDNSGTPIEEYLKPTAILDSTHPEVVRFAQEVVGDATDPVLKARKLFYAVRDKIAYDVQTPFYLPEHYQASAVLKRGRGFCVPKASLLCALGRACGIPSRLGLTDIRNQGASPELIEMMGCDIFTYHGFVEFLLNGKWVKLTPAFDQVVFEKHQIPPVEFDGEHDAVLPSHDLNGKPYVTYIKYHGSFADLPLDEVLLGWDRTYGPERVRAWREAFEAAQDQLAV